MKPTDAELTLLRTRPHKTHLYLSIYKPDTIFACQVNDADIVAGEISIAYDGSTGTYTDIDAGMTMYIGSNVGGTDYGRIRVRSASDTTIVVAENNDINWQDNLYLTIKDFHEVWPIYQTLQQVGSTISDADVLVYKDRDVEYTNQNDYPGSLIWMGGHQAALLDETGHAQIYWSATGTVNVAGQSLTYNWDFEGGTPSSGTTVTPGNIEYDTPGHYVTTLSVTSSSGTVDTSYRYVSIYDDDHPPVRQWGMNDLSGSRDEGAYTTTIWIKEPVDEIVEGALVVIFSDNWYGSTHQSINGKIVFAGYILNNSIVYNWKTSTVEFDVGSVTEVMKLCEGPGISLTSSATVNSWSVMRDIDISKAIWFYLRWHTTVLNVADVCYTGEDYLIYRFETDSGNLYDVLNTFTKNTLFGSCIANRQGQIICEIDPEGVNGLILPLNMSIDRQDWANEPSIREQSRAELSYLEGGGAAYSSVTGTDVPYMSCAPGLVPAYFGRSDEQEGLALLSQEHLNTLIGNVYANRNARYPEIGLDFAGNYANLELAPSERYLLTVTPTDSQKRVNLINKAVHPMELTWRYLPDKEFFSPTGIFHELTTGIGGMTMEIPQEPVINIPPPPSIVLPPIVSPPGIIPWIPPFVPPEPPETGDDCLTLGCYHPGNGPYSLYPENPVMNINSPHTYVWFPCVIRNCDYDPLDRNQAPTKIVVDHSINGVRWAYNDGISSVDLIRSDKSIIATYSMDHGETIFEYPDSLEVAGFRLNQRIFSTGINYVEDMPYKGASVTLGSAFAWATSGKAMGFIEAANHLSDWPWISPWGRLFKVHVEGTYTVTQERISVQKLSGGAEGLVYIPSTEYIVGGTEFFYAGYNMHFDYDAANKMLNVLDVATRTPVSHMGVTYHGDYYFGLGTYWDDAFGPPSAHASSYILNNVEINTGGAWLSMLGTAAIPTVFIHGIQVYNICTT